MIKVRFHGQSSPINGEPKSWDYTLEFQTDGEASESITEYLIEHDDDPLANYEIL